jgi:hypothetical protein
MEYFHQLSLIQLKDVQMLTKDLESSLDKLKKTVQDDQVVALRKKLDGLLSKPFGNELHKYEPTINATIAESLNKQQEELNRLMDRQLEAEKELRLLNCLERRGENFPTLLISSILSIILAIPIYIIISWF